MEDVTVTVKDLKGFRKLDFTGKKDLLATDFVFK